MGRPQKEKNNYEERFKELFEEKEISGNAELLRKMYAAYYKGKLGVNTDRQTWVNSQAPDLSKKIKGERGFTETDIKAIERALEMSWVDIVEPLPKKNEQRAFKNKSLSYAAYMDEERYYQELADIEDVDGCRSVLLNSDEHGKTIIDYIVENKAENGLRFMINEGYLRCTSLKFYWVRTGDDLYDALWDWIISIDDPELFFKLLEDKSFFDFLLYPEEESEKFLERIIESKKILGALFNEREHPESKLKYMASLLFEVLKCSLNRNDKAIVERIISADTKFVEDQMMAFRNETNQDSNKRFEVYRLCSGQSEIYYDGSLIMYVWDFSKLNEKFNGFEDQIEPLQISNIIEKLVVKNLSAMEYGDSFVKDGIYYIKKKPDISLEALIYLTGEKNCKFLPDYIGEESGVTKICAYNSWYNASFKELGEMLGEIHALSQEKLGENRVYMYSRGFASNGCFGHTISKETTVIGSWQICDIGTPIFDIISAFLNYCKRLYGYYEEPHRCFIEGKANLYEELSVFLNAYPAKKVIENFGDKLNEELDKRLKDAIQGKKVTDIERIYMIKSFAEIYRENLNSITRCTSNI